MIQILHEPSLRIGKCLEFRRQEETIANRYDNDKGDDTARDTSCQEVRNAQVALSCVAIFHHDGS